jgi:hypothetical protein
VTVDVSQVEGGRKVESPGDSDEKKEAEQAGEQAKSHHGSGITDTITLLLSFHPETALFRRDGVNPQACLCGVPMYASAQPLDFLTITKNCSFPI